MSAVARRMEAPALMAPLAFDHERQLWLPAPWAAPPSNDPREKPPRTHARARTHRVIWTQTEFRIVTLWDFQREGKRRKCSPFSRARTINVAKLGTRLKQGAHTEDLFDVSVQALRPRNRLECVDGPRPCPWVGCRYHIALSVDPERGSIKETFPHLQILEHPEGPGLEVLEELVGTCALDACNNPDDPTGDGGVTALYLAAKSGRPLGQTPGLTIQETGRKLNISIERTRQLNGQAMQEMRVKIRSFE